MSGSVITFPDALLARGQARRLVTTVGETCVVNAAACRKAHLGALDEFVKRAIDGGAERVIVVNAPDTLKRQLQHVHRARATPERTFLMTFREVPIEELLRPV